MLAGCKTGKESNAPADTAAGTAKSTSQDTVAADQGEGKDGYTIAVLAWSQAEEFGVDIISGAEKKAAELGNVTIDRFREADLPAIILIPGVSGNTGRGIMAVKKSVEQAVGSDIIFNGQ